MYVQAGVDLHGFTSQQIEDFLREQFNQVSGIMVDVRVGKEVLTREPLYSFCVAGRSFTWCSPHATRAKVLSASYGLNYLPIGRI